MQNILLVFIGGGIGSVIRFLLGYFFGLQKYHQIYSTLFANVLSCVIIALVMSQNNSFKNSNVQAFWAIGLCGGLSTFSTFSWQNWQLINSNQWLFLSFNILSNIALTILAIGVGLKISSINF
jgi:CrcB protein